MQIQKRQIVIGPVERGRGPRQIGGDVDGIAMRVQMLGHRRSQIRFILDHQKPHGILRAVPAPGRSGPF